MANHQTKQRRNQRSKQSDVNYAVWWAERLPGSVKDALSLLDHPKFKEDHHSMYSYVLWLCQKGYLNKAQEVVNAHTSPD